MIVITEKITVCWEAVSEYIKQRLYYGCKSQATLKIGGSDSTREEMAGANEKVVIGLLVTEKGFFLGNACYP